MPIQIEQTLPRCLRCGRVVHTRSRARIEEADGALFCSEICRYEYAELERERGSASGSSPNR